MKLHNFFYIYNFNLAVNVTERKSVCTTYHKKLIEEKYINIEKNTHTDIEEESKIKTNVKSCAKHEWKYK